MKHSFVKQFHHTDLGESVVQTFRRPEATSETLTVKLQGLTPQQRYEVENLDGGKEVRTAPNSCKATPSRCARSLAPLSC